MLILFRHSTSAILRRGVLVPGRSRDSAVVGHIVRLHIRQAEGVSTSSMLHPWSGDCL